MNYHIRFTEEASADLERLYDFLIEQTPSDLGIAECALSAIGHGIALLETTPFSCRKADPRNPFLRELVIGFGATGYVALFEIEDDRTVTILAVRHQREDDYH